MNEIDDIDLELIIRDMIFEIEETNHNQMSAYQNKFEENGFLFQNSSFEDQDNQTILYFELAKNQEEYIVFIYYSNTALEISEYYVTDKKLCTFKEG